MIDKSLRTLEERELAHEQEIEELKKDKQLLADRVAKLEEALKATIALNKIVETVLND